MRDWLGIPLRGVRVPVGVPPSRVAIRPTVLVELALCGANRRADAVRNRVFRAAIPLRRVSWPSGRVGNRSIGAATRF